MSAPAERTAWSRTDYTLALARLSLATSGPMFEAERLKTSGRLDDARREYRTLIDVLERQLALTEELNAELPRPHLEVASIASTLSNTLMTLADVEATLGARGEADRIRNQAAAIAAHYLPPADVAQRKRELAAVRAAQSRYHEAITLLTEARDELARRGDVLPSAQVSAQLAETLEWLGDTARAGAEAARATAALEPLLPGQAPSMADLLVTLTSGDLQTTERRARVLQLWLQLAQLDARARRDAGDLEGAAARFREVRPRVPSVAAPAIDFQLARIEIQAGRPDAGLAMLAALEPSFTGLLRPKLGALLSWRAQGLLALGRPDEALAAATPAVAELLAHGDLDSLWRVQWVRARVLLELGRTDEARAQLADAVETVTALRHGSLGHRLDSTYLADKLPVIEAAIELAVRRGHADDACRYIELVKARGLTAILSLPRGGDAPTEGPDGALDAVSRQLDQLEYAAFARGPSDELAAQRAALLQRRSALLEQIRITDPRWRALSEPPPFDPAALATRLGRQRRAALTVYLRGDDLVAVVVDGDGCAAALHPMTARTRAALDRYRDSLAGAQAPIDPGELPGLELDALVPAALVARALRADSLVIAPHGFLHLVPWAMLRWQGDRLFQHRPSSVVPNLSCLTQVPPMEGAATAVGLIGNPAYARRDLPRLPLAGDELHEIADTHGHGHVLGGRVVEGLAATEAAFRALAGRADAAGATLHVVCHGDFVAEEPLYSGLLLADGKIDAAEIARMPLRYHEAVLSACSSGYRATAVEGVPLTGDDIVGLVGAFLEAGTRAVMVSITRARDDASHAFMIAYHRGRAAGAPPVQALQAAQRELLAAGTYAPALWAGFVVYGT